MAKSERESGSALLNASLLILGLFVAVLLYALVVRVATPRSDPHRAVDAPTHLIGDIIQVDVRNACGVSGLAGETRNFLRQQGFDVVEVGDHSNRDLAHSMVVDRAGDLRTAQKVARALGIPDDRVVQDIRESYYLDVSVLVGKDYEQLRPFR